LGIWFLPDVHARDVAAGIRLELDGDPMRIGFSELCNFALDAFEVAYGPLPLETWSY
jgi:hypothetical protein